jgi:arylsulfate sulfotransferase
MWHPLTLFRKRAKARPAPVRRTRLFRPHLEALEDRCLLSVSLNGPSEGLVGSPGTWTATASDLGTSPVYQFSVTPAGGASQMVQDFSTSNTFAWASMQEGNYTIQVTAKASYSATTSETGTTTYTGDSRITGNSAVINSTSNPLVALYSAPPSAGSSMYVQFSPDVADPSWQNTASQTIVPGESTNFLVSGLQPNTTYLMRDVVDNGTPSASLTFTTGSLPTNLTFPNFSVQQGPTSATDSTDNMIFHAGINPAPGNVDLLATDLSGNIDWYYDPTVNSFYGYGVNLVPGGTIYMLGGTSIGGAGGYDTLRQIDLLGDLLRETNINAVNAQLANMIDPITGETYDPIFNFSHDALTLPNGDTAVIAGTKRVIDINGTPTTYTSDDVIVLDQNFQVKWVWDALDWLDPTRLPTDGEGPSDFTHANSISWSPANGNLLVSLRAQDWVLEINYDNGAGDGNIVWRLGAGGSFTLTNNPSDSSLWFSHQHDVQFINDNTITVFDDGNTRHMTDPNADSRGQEYVLNEQKMTATLVVNADLGNYSSALGAAQVLSNGNLDFTSGFLAGPAGQSIEVSPDGTINYVQQQSGIEYRSYFMSNLYEGDNFDQGLLDTGFENPSVGTGASAYQDDPTSSPWSFSGAAGLAGNGSAITSGNPNAPQGTQVAFLQGTSSTISQEAINLAPGAYQLSVSAAQGGDNSTGNSEEVQVEVDGTVVATFTPTSTSYATYATPLFNLTAGNHTITFVGVDPTGAGDTALLDQVNFSIISTPSATFLNTDTSTEGNWQNVYGSQGYNVIDNASSYPSYAQVSASGYSNYIWTTSTSDPRALQEVGSSNGIAAVWYSPSSFTINVNITDGQTHQVALYLLDWDQWGGGRSEEVDILDAVTGNVLSTETASNFSNGDYLVWNVSGHIQFRITNLNSSSNAVLNGLFFDPAGTPPPPPPPPSPGTASFLKTDTSTEGSWQSVYGSQGYNVIDNASSYPSYAQVSTRGTSNYVWSSSTTDPRALQDASGSGRIAATWYSSSSFTVNVDLTDGQTHQLALYLIDWDNWGGGRSEEVDILDATTGKVLSTETVSNFQNGEYLVWNVSGDVEVRITNLNGNNSNAVLSGLFLDPKA